MRSFANLFMGLFLFDGCLSVVDELLRYNTSDDGLLGLRMLVAFVVVTLAFIVYIGLLFDRRLPKLVLLPQTLFAFWGVTGLWPLPFFYLSDNLGVIVAGLQVSLGLLPFFILRGGTGRGGLLKSDRFKGAGFSGRNLLFGILATLVIVPVFLVIFAGAGALELVQNSTAGFMSIDARGITMQERIYKRGDKTVRLTSMIHIGDQDYYDRFAASVDSPRTLILAEGVSDRDGLLTKKFSYEKLAGLLGLSSQQQMPLQGDVIEPADLDHPADKDNLTRPKILHADVDLSDFDAQTVELLNALGRDLFGGDDLAEGILTYNEWVEQNMTQARYETLMYDVLTRRNQVVLHFLEKALESYDVVVIPWGALHMRGIEEGVKARGFRLKDTRERLSVDFDKIDLGGLVQTLIN